MKHSLGFDSQCGERVGPPVTVSAFQHRSLGTRKPRHRHNSCIHKHALAHSMYAVVKSTCH